ncbi:MAG TPA: HYR domain-containing protein [Archangium sp.]|uniref:HYR domain-containing protein n=1 Tax=Archangium sp. TaxID=1872627 RepID=UPI002E3289A2|nr:HYR domain-containing protein [Archangium sp.]HEX5746568.1 HYR domain-containing protein [Archangium sp.]
MRNQGQATAAAGLKVAFSAGNPASGGTLLAVARLAEALPAGTDVLVTTSVASPGSGTAELFVRVDDDGTGSGRDAECREDNNTASASVDLTCEVPPGNLPPVALCRDVTVPADASCQGYASVDNGSHDPDHGPATVTCSRPSGSLFLPGLTNVTCTATDASGNTASCDFGIRVSAAISLP